MKKAIVVETADVKKILAKEFGVSEDQVIKAQYTFTVMLPEDESAEERGEE